MNEQQMATRLDKIANEYLIGSGSLETLRNDLEEMVPYLRRPGLSEQTQKYRDAVDVYTAMREVLQTQTNNTTGLPRIVVE
jgi:hypothetical protein